MDDMSKVESQILALKRRSEAALNEMQNAITFHEVWRPSAYDDTLLQRFDESYAANALVVIRTALRRQMLLSLMKIWDNNDASISMLKIERTLKDNRMRKALIVLSKKNRPPGRWTGDQPSDEMKNRQHQQLLDETANQVSNDIDCCLEIINEYKKGSKSDFLKDMRSIRNEHLAHRQITVAAIRHVKEDYFGNAVEEFYQDTQYLVKTLYSITHRTSYDFKGLGTMWAGYAQKFWASASGERHASYPGIRRQLQQIEDGTLFPDMDDEKGGEQDG